MARPDALDVPHTVPGHAAKRCTMSTSFSAAAKKMAAAHGETGLAAMMVRESGAEAP